MKNMKIISLALLLVLLLAACATPSYVIDNSRLKHQAFEAGEITALALEQTGDEGLADLAALFAEEQPNIVVIKAEKKTIAGIVDTLPLNVVKVSSGMIIATTGTIETKEESGTVISFDDTYELQVLIDSSDYWKGPVIIAGSEGYEGVSDIYEATHAGNESLPFTFFTNGVLPLTSEEAGDTYPGYQGISCSFGLAE